MKALKRIVPFAVIAAAAALLLYLPDIGPERYSDLAAFFRVEMKRQGYAGLSVAAVADGSVLYVDGFGVDGAGAAIRPDTPLYVPAAAKSMAALAALSLVDDRRLSLDAPVRDYVPWLDLGGGKVTLRHLLTHTSGYADSAFDDLHPGAESLAAGARCMLGAAPSAAPGERFQYIDTGYQALGLAMEAAARKSYAAILSERIFRPLGMKSSSARVSASPPSGSASFFSLAVPRRAPSAPYGAPSGYVTSSAADMGQYMAFLLAPGKFERRPVPPGVVPSIFAPLLPSSPYGFGLFLGRDSSGRIAYHDGSLEGFSSRILLRPDSKTGVAVIAAQGSLLQSLFALPALTEGAMRIIEEGSSARPFPLGRLYILLAVVAGVHLLAISAQTAGALRWTKEVRDRAEAKGSDWPLRFAALRCWVGIAARIALAALCPAAVGLAFGRVVSWSTLFDLEPGLSAWLLAACMFGILRNTARLAWGRGSLYKLSRPRR